MHQDAHRVIVVLEEPNRNPYEVWVLAALFLSGLLFLLGLSSSQSVSATLPEFSRTMWALQLVTGTAAALIGMFWNQPTVGRTIQIAGHLWTGSGAFIYACVLFYYNGWVATMTGLIVGSITIAAVTKSLQLRRQIKQILRVVKEQNGSGTLNGNGGGDISATS